jgi:hypothetical protein
MPNPLLRKRFTSRIASAIRLRSVRLAGWEIFSVWARVSFTSAINANRSGNGRSPGSPSTVNDRNHWLYSSGVGRSAIPATTHLPAGGVSSATRQPVAVSSPSTR